MIPATLEKLSYRGAVVVLYLQHRVASTVLLFASIDLRLAVRFFIAFRRTAPSREPESSRS
jgi:hypothetical protein